MGDVGLVALKDPDGPRLRSPPEARSQAEMLEADVGGRYLLDEPGSHEKIGVQGAARARQQTSNRALLADDLSDQRHRVVVQVHPTYREQPHTIGDITLDSLRD